METEKVMIHIYSPYFLYRTPSNLYNEELTRKKVPELGNGQ